MNTGTAIASNGEIIMLPQRYNNVGEWKPLVAKTEFETLNSINAEILNLTKNPEIQGVLKYIKYTGVSVLEFVVRTNLDLCEEGKTILPDIHLFKCPRPDDVKSVTETSFIYDGWIALENQTPEFIQQTIEYIDIKLRLIASYYQASLEWRTKYGVNIGNRRDLCKPDEESLNQIALFLKHLPINGQNFSTAENSISWYSRGVSSRDVFVKFVSFYIALEVLAASIYDGVAIFDIGLEKKNKTTRKQERIACIKRLHEQLYEEDPIGFIEQGYFDCIQSLKSKTKKVVEKIFGEEHQFIKELFEIQYKGYTLQNIRNKIAHGDFSKNNTAISNIVWERLPLMQQISREFLFRILLQLKPTENLPSYSGASSSMRSAYSPNGLIVSDLSILSNQDWHIRPEWFDD